MATLPEETIAAMSQRPASSFPWVPVVGGLLVIVVLGGFFVVRAHSADSSAGASPSAASDLEALLASPAGSGTAALDLGDPRGQVLAKSSLADAIGVARPLMANTIGRLDVGSALLSLWASRALTWEALDAIPETSPALFRKDPDTERGKRFCISGTIVQIRAEKTLSARVVEDRTPPLIERPATMNGGSMQPTDHAEAPSDSSAAEAPSATSQDLLGLNTDFTIPDGSKVFVATVQSRPDAVPLLDSNHPGTRPPPSRGEGMIAEVIAVRSSGGLVDGSEARACGILTGVTLPASDTSGSGPSDIEEHRIVGMFDLPENHGAIGGELAHHGG
jgi:hypothetical protein